MGLGLWNGSIPRNTPATMVRGNVCAAGQVIGSVNYATGRCSSSPTSLSRFQVPSTARSALAGRRAGQMFRLNYGGINYVDAPSLYPNDESGYVKLRYNSAGSTSNHSETFAFSPSFPWCPASTRRW